MANELQVSIGTTGRTIYFLIRSRTAQIWNTSNNAFENFVSGQYSLYTVSAVEQDLTGYYVGSFPTAIPPGTYSVIAKQQISGTPAVTDPTVGANNLEWGGAALLPLSDLATSGQLATVGPIRIARGAMVQNFPFFLRSASDHTTSFVSGIVSGQISRDGGNFGPLQSGLVTEVGLGWYKCNLTSGDLLANTIALHFTANGVSGGTADPLPLAFVLQKTSGQV